jgi:hypothetical protein
MAIITKEIGTDEESGLPIHKQITSFFVDGDKKEITICYKKVVVTPTGLICKELENGSLTRDKVKYDQLDIHPIGMGVKQMLMLDLDGLYLE